MKKLSSLEELQESIQLLEIQQKIEEDLLKEQFKDTLASFQPINLVKRTLDDLTDLPDLKGNILNTSVSLLTGYLSKKLIFHSSHNPIKQALGGMIQMGVTNLVSNKLGDLNSLFSFFKGKKEKDLN